MSWLRRAPAETREKVEAMSNTLDIAASRRQGALRKLLAVMDAIPLEQGLAGLGSAPPRGTPKEREKDGQ